MRTKIVRLLVVAVIAITAVVIAYTWPVSLRTLPPGMGCALGSLEGTIHGDRWAEPHVWVDVDGRAREEIIWPAGYSARFMPSLLLLDADGTVVAREGDRVSLDGKFTCSAPRVIGKS
jgi:hypothetical protein